MEEPVLIRIKYKPTDYTKIFELLAQQKYIIDLKALKSGKMEIPISQQDAVSKFEAVFSEDGKLTNELTVPFFWRDVVEEIEVLEEDDECGSVDADDDPYDDGCGGGL